MAYALSRKQISPEQEQIIKNNLTFLPQQSKFENQYNKEALPISFYRSDEEFIHIPYLYAAGLLKIYPNMDNKYLPVPFQFTGQLRKEQVSVETEAMSHIRQLGTTLLGLDPGFGKTILGAKLACNLGLLTVILVHREILCEQWRKTFSKFTNASTWIVGEKNPPATAMAIICMDTRWNSISKEIRDQVGLLIVDEAHAFCTPARVDCLLAFHPKYVVAETATLERDDGMHIMIQSICGEHGVYREGSKPFTVIKLLTQIKPVVKNDYRGRMIWSSAVSSLAFDDRRNKMILDLAQKNSNNTILILTNLVEHTMLLYNKLKEMNQSVDYMCGDRKAYSDCRILVGTTSKIGTGFDQATACADFSGRTFDLLILTFSIKKYAMLVQNVGRALRSENPTVIYLVDDSPVYESHWTKSCKWFQRRGAKIMVHDMGKQVTADAEVGMSQWMQKVVSQFKKK